MPQKTTLAAMGLRTSEQAEMLFVGTAPDARTSAGDAGPMTLTESGGPQGGPGGHYRNVTM
jgi:hypothetical protein